MAQVILAVGAAARKGFAPRADMVRAIVGGLVFADGASGRDLRAQAAQVKKWVRRSLEYQGRAGPL